MYVTRELAKFVLRPAVELVVASVEAGRYQCFDVRSVLVVLFKGFPFASGKSLTPLLFLPHQESGIGNPP